jgi:hypothetical protein
MATESGSKDKYLQHFVDKLQAAASKLREDQKEGGSGLSESNVSKKQQVKNLLAQLHAEMPANIFNPVLSIDGQPFCFKIQIGILIQKRKTSTQIGIPRLKFSM